MNEIDLVDRHAELTQTRLQSERQRQCGEVGLLDLRGIRVKTDKKVRSEKRVDHGLQTQFDFTHLETLAFGGNFGRAGGQIGEQLTDDADVRIQALATSLTLL